MAHPQPDQPDDQGSEKPHADKPHTAGAFDIRFIIAALIGAYGAVLTIFGLFVTSAEELAKADDLNINLWAGLGMLAAAAFFALWARLRPVIVPPDE